MADYKKIIDVLTNFATEMTTFKEGVSKEEWERIKGGLQIQLDADFDPETAHEILTVRRIEEQ